MDSQSGPQHQHPPKAEKTDLEMFLRVSGPELLRKHAANILLGVLLLAAATMFLYTRYRNKAAEQMATNQNTAIAYDLASEARAMFNSPLMGDDDSRLRQQKARQVFETVEGVLASDAGGSQKAAALLAKAEVLWLLGNAPEQALTTTQPVLGFTQRKPADYLNDAEAEYTEIATKHSGEKEYAANALISLAAIAETRGNFDLARTRYQQVIDDEAIRPTYHDIAASRIKLLETLSKPYTLATPATRPTTAAATAPSMPLMLTPPAGPAPGLALPPSLDQSIAPATAPATLPTTAP